MVSVDRKIVILGVFLIVKLWNKGAVSGLEFGRC